MFKHCTLIGLAILCCTCSTGVEHYTTQPPATKASFATEDLHELLIAEVAYQRGHYELALRHYHNTTLSSLSKKLAARTTRLALELNQPEMALEPAIIWANQAPTNPRPQALVVLMLISGHQYEEALPYLSRITTSKKATPYLELVTEESTALEQTNLALLFKELYRQQRFHPEAGLIIAKFIYTEQPLLARDILKDILEKRPNWPEALSFKTQIRLD